MRFLFLFLLTGCLGTCFGQEVKIYITTDGRYSSDAKNAIQYLLVNEIQQDSGYKVKEFNMQDTILLSGYYLDKLLTIRNGEFIYYRKNFSTTDRAKSIISNRADTENYI
jgi:hypothetical protein